MSVSNKVLRERKVERAIHKALRDLQLLTGIYIGERQIERGDTIPHEEVWKRLKEKYQFKLSDKEKNKIRRVLENEDCEREEIAYYVFGLIEKRDEKFKRRKPKMYPSPYPNHL
jgi:hypothetical protein